MANETDHYDVLELIKNTKRVVEENQWQEKQFDSCNTEVDVASLTQHLHQLAKSKQDAKDKFHKTLTTQSFMKNLVKPREQWDAVITHNEEELQKARSSLKEATRRVDDQKNKVMQLNTVSSQALCLYEENLKSLMERMQHLEKLQKELEEVMERTACGETEASLALMKETEGWLGRCNADLQQCRLELKRLEHSEGERESGVVCLEEELEQLAVTLDSDQEAMDNRCLLRLQQGLSSMEALSGVTCQAPTADTFLVSFPPTNQSASVTDGDDLVLRVTLTFQRNAAGSLRLTGAQSNVEDFDFDDLWKDYSEGGVDSLPSFVHAVKLRWTSHVPLLSEINHLRCRHAIDWIQQEGLLRVIVGRGGSVVCSLLIPPAYPHQGQVTLTGIMGASHSLDLEELKPSTGSLLEDWVCYLEEKFGKP